MAQQVEATRKTRRAPDPNGKPRRTGGRRAAVSPQVAVYEAASRHPLIPRVGDPSPTVTARQQRYLQVLARHLYRNDPFIRNLVNTACRIHIGDGPVPVSRFPELDDLWSACSDAVDNTGRRSFGGWLRQDVYRNYRIDGEVFVRRRDRIDAPEARDLTVPLEWEAHQSEFCPHDYSQVGPGNLRYNCGVATVRGKPVSYAFHRSHPGEIGANRNFLFLSPSEIFHVADPLTGSPRGEVLIACALLRAIKMSTLEDSELRRKQVASLISVFIKRPVDGTDDGDLIPSEEEVGEMIDAVALSPGGVFELPYGYDIQTFEPKDEPANFERCLRWQLMAICASVGMPVNEVTGDDNGVERYGRYLTQRVQSAANLERDNLRFQLVDPMHDYFTDTARAVRMWTPPASVRWYEIYERDWRWPIIPAARLDLELRALLEAAKEGVINQGYITQSLFGMEPKVVVRAAAADNARLTALGHQAVHERWLPDTPTAQRIMDAVTAEEEIERDLVDASDLEDSILD